MPTRSRSVAPSRDAASSDPRVRAPAVRTASVRVHGLCSSARPLFECTASARSYPVRWAASRALGTIPCARVLIEPEVIPCTVRACPSARDPCECAASARTRSPRTVRASPSARYAFEGTASARLHAVRSGLSRALEWAECSGCPTHGPGLTECTACVRVHGLRPSARPPRVRNPCNRRYPAHSGATRTPTPGPRLETGAWSVRRGRRRGRRHRAARRARTPARATSCSGRSRRRGRPTSRT